MIQLLETKITELLQEQASMIYLKIGYVLFAELAKTSSK